MNNRLGYLTPPRIEGLRLTIPVREALEAAGNTVALDSNYRWTVTMIRPPKRLVLALVGYGQDQSLALRMENEPKWLGEWPDGAGVSWWDYGTLVPCPTCGHSLLWCEAGFVPGWRICLAGHANQLSGDGRSATRYPAHDASTLRATKPA